MCGLHPNFRQNPKMGQNASKWVNRLSNKSHALALPNSFRRSTISATSTCEQNDVNTPTKKKHNPRLSSLTSAPHPDYEIEYFFSKIVWNTRIYARSASVSNFERNFKLELLFEKKTPSWVYKVNIQNLRYSGGDLKMGETRELALSLISWVGSPDFRKRTVGDG